MARGLVPAAARLAAAVVMVAGLAGCARTQARTVPDRVPLEVPPAPPRFIEPLPSEPITEDVTAAPEPPPAAPPVPPRPRTGAAGAAPRPEPAAPRPEPAPARAAAPRLQTPQTAADAEIERKIRESLSRAARDLNSVNESALNRDARAQYDTARRFIQQAEEGLEAKNYVFAGYLADKAQTIASLLAR